MSSSAVFCPVCSRMFDHPNGNPRHIANMLNQHMQTHRPRNVSCPVCGDTRFKSGANAVSHVESGACRGCRGKDNARKNIYDFVAKNEASRGLLAERPALDYCGRPMEMDLPDKPYKCQSCGRRYSQLSSLMQHQEYNPRCNNRSNQLPLTFRGY